MVDKNNVSNIFPLTPLQEGMLYRQLASGNSGAYIMQSRLWVNGILDKPDFQKAWSMIVDRHEALRTLFVTEGTDRPLQIVLKHLNIEIPLCDLSKNSESDRNAKIDQYCKEELASGFDLKSPPLFRLKLFRYSTAQHLFVMTFHHIIMDGWCQGILHDELLECYHAIRNRRRPNLAAVPSFSGYVRYLSGLNTDEGLSYWKSALEGYEPGRETSWMKRTQLTEGQFDLNRETFTLSGERLNRLRSMAAELGITLNTVFQTLWGTVISRLSGKRDIVWGTVVSGRPPELPGSDRIIGLFINTVPVRFQLDLTVTFREALNSMGEFLRKSMQHQHMPLAEVQSFSGARGNLFDHLLIFENYPAEMIENRGDDNLTIVPESPLSGHTDYDLVCVVDADENLECLLKYNATVIEDENVKLIRDSLLKLTDTVLDNPDSPLAMIQLLPKKILDTVLYRLPIGKTLDQCTMTFPELFAAQVAETPERPAVEAVDGNFSYRDLDKVSDTISHDLIEKAGIQPGDTVAVMTGRNRTMIPSIIGIMKASAVFVPLDPGYPDERIRFILEDCGCSVVIADSKSLTRLKRYDFITVIDAEEVITRQMSVKTPKKWPEPDDVAYIIYTSGSTGKPKGVMIEHRQLSNFIQGYTNSVLDKHDNPLRIAFIANYVFDASGRAFYPSLCRGDTVCVVDEETRLDGFALTRFIKTDHIDLLDGTPSLCSLIVDCGTRCDTLKRVVLGGEALRHTLVDRIDKVFPNAALTNVYGPTETTIDSTFFYVGSSNNENLDIAPIGRPLPNQQVYVLDDALNPLPVGAIGEICIGGVGVGRGYLNRKDLTRMSFVPNPFSSGDKLYRTGDLGCWRNDENLLFLGRRDFQIKVRGFRIETGEIEVAISSVPQISECAVVLRTDADSNNTLCAYYVGDSDPQELRDNIKRILPSHMIPDMFFQIDQMPFTPSGKIDRITLSRLIEKGLDNIPRKQVHVTATGQQIIEAMGKVLNRDNICPDDNFFEIGGHSLAAARLIALLASKIKKRLPVSAVYRFPTANDLADFTDRYDPAMSELIDEFRFHFGEGDKVLYCFPPYGATGIVYHTMSRFLKGYRLECFNFLDGIDFVEEAVRILLPESRKSPLILLGYSGGGNLAFEVAFEIEKYGGSIERLILIDSYRRMESVKVSRARHEQEMKKILTSDEYTVLFPDSHSRNKALQNGVAYAEYLCSVIEKGFVHAQIDVLRAHDDIPDPSRDRFGALRSRGKWSELTNATFHMIQGTGTHDEMLNEKNSLQNSILIRQILEDCTT